VRGGKYEHRILKVEKPANQPVMLSTKFDFVTNFNVAKPLGLTIPPDAFHQANIITTTSLNGSNDIAV
jgi:ABC-type uncharacterized transport system substrate-binding protein